MSIFKWVRTWTGAYLFAAPILIIIVAFICGMAYVGTPTEPEFNPETGEYYKSKSEVRADIWIAFKVVGILIPCIYALGVLLGSAIVSGLGLLQEDKVKFK